MLKRCSKCKIEKNINDFYKRSDTKKGIRSHCKKCYNEYLKVHRKLPHIKNYYKKYSLLKKYGLTLKEYEQMVKQQENKCLICGKKKQLVVDHNHKTKKIRGLLCSQCNRALGFVYENKMILLKLVNYIDIYK